MCAEALGREPSPLGEADGSMIGTTQTSVMVPTTDEQASAETGDEVWEAARSCTHERRRVGGAPQAWRAARAMPALGYNP